jgi:hypothetical protein
MTNKHDFTGKSIKCETWEQMLHLAKLAEVQHNATSFLDDSFFSENNFNNEGCVYFIFDPSDATYLIQSVHSALNEIEISYSAFINTLPTEVVEVTGCGDCLMSSSNHDYDYFRCSHPNQITYVEDYSGTKGRDKLFTTCPFKKASITIKLKHND